MQYFIGKNGQQLGPFSEEEVKTKLAAGEISAYDMAWREGMEGWLPVGQVFPNPYQPAAALGDSPLFAGKSKLRLADPLIRLGAVLLDGVLGLISASPALVGVFLMAPAISAASSSTDPGSTAPSTASILAVAIGGIMALAFGIYQLVILSTRGQTVAKRLLGIRIVNFDDEQNPGFVKAVLLRAFVPGLIGSIPILGVIFTIVDSCFIFRPDRRCIHDLMANTKVIFVG